MQFLSDECVFPNVEFQAGDVRPQAGSEMEMPPRAEARVAPVSVTLQIKGAAAQLVEAVA